MNVVEFCIKFKRFFEPDVAELINNLNVDSPDSQIALNKAIGSLVSFYYSKSLFILD